MSSNRLRVESELEKIAKKMPCGARCARWVKAPARPSSGLPRRGAFRARCFFCTPYTLSSYKLTATFEYPSVTWPCRANCGSASLLHWLRAFSSPRKSRSSCQGSSKVKVLTLWKSAGEGRGPYLSLFVLYNARFVWEFNLSLLFFAQRAAVSVTPIQMLFLLTATGS